jgi:hypothetical protein
MNICFGPIEHWYHGSNSARAMDVCPHRFCFVLFCVSIVKAL